MNDSDYMSIALKLARKGCKKVSPNPMAGAVIVREGRIIGQGSHLYFGGPHAERNALASLTESPRGATLYVTLEPCCHHGKTPALHGCHHRKRHPPGGHRHKGSQSHGIRQGHQNLNNQRH